METTNTTISPWLHSVQYYGGDSSSIISESILRIQESITRTRATAEKINSILNTLYGLEEGCGVSLTPYHERMQDMIDIRNAIGVYGIYHTRHSRRRHEPNMLWYKEEPASEHSSSYKEGKLWRDYFGKDDGITDIGGFVVVSLSHSGILYLNSISEGVSYLSSSYDTTVTT